MLAGTVGIQNLLLDETRSCLSEQLRKIVLVVIPSQDALRDEGQYHTSAEEADNDPAA